VNLERGRDGYESEVLISRKQPRNGTPITRKVPYCSHEGRSGSLGLFPASSMEPVWKVSVDPRDSSTPPSHLRLLAWRLAGSQVKSSQVKSSRFDCDAGDDRGAGARERGEGRGVRPARGAHRLRRALLDGRRAARDERTTRPRPAASPTTLQPGQAEAEGAERCSSAVVVPSISLPARLLRVVRVFFVSPHRRRSRRRSALNNPTGLIQVEANR
jgi:hypothetical protein